MNTVLTIIIGILITVGLIITCNLSKTPKEDLKQIYCPHCGTTNTNQTTKMIIVMQLPGAAVDCACFYCNVCSKRWFMELDTLKQTPGTYYI